MAKPRSYCTQENREAEIVLSDPFAITKGDHIIICGQTLSGEWKLHSTWLRKQPRLELASAARSLHALAYSTVEGGLLKFFVLSENIHGEKWGMDDAQAFIRLTLGKLLLISCPSALLCLFPFLVS